MGKKCLRCENVKSLDCFHNNKNKKDGKDSYCKTCHKQNRDAHKQHTQIVKHNYRQNNVQKCLLLSAKHRAKRKNIDFDLELCDITVPDLCPVLGIELFVGTNKITNNSPTIDRIDNSKGYIRGNVVVVSNKANRLKNNATIDEIEKLYNFYVGRNE